MRPVLLVIAGPNGAGKTTVTERLRRDLWSEGVEYLNPDEIARDRFGSWNDPSSVLEAARWTEARREELLAQRKGIAFETVFSAPDKIAFLQRARASGYFLRFFFVSTSDPRINAARVADRILRGGHTVPIEKILQRYARSMANLSAALSLCDRVYLFDNSINDQDAVLHARVVDGHVRKIYSTPPGWIVDALEPLPAHVDFTGP